MTAPYGHGRTLLTPKEVAADWKVSARHVRRLVEEGQLVGVRIGAKRWRFEPEEIAAYLARRRGVADAPESADAPQPLERAG